MSYLRQPLAAMASNAADAISREFTAIINKDTETQLSFELKRQIGLPRSL